jgi:hypothetical protein
MAMTVLPVCLCCSPLAGLPLYFMPEYLSGVLLRVTRLVGRAMIFFLSLCSSHGRDQWTILDLASLVDTTIQHHFHQSVMWR